MIDPTAITALEAPPPRGFEVRPLDSERLEITYRRDGMGCMLVFLVVWAVGWTWAMVALVVDPSLRAQQPVMSAIFLLFGVPADVLVLGLIAWMVFGRTVIVLSRDWLEVEKRVGPWRSRQRARRDAIASVVQIKDGGESSDSFPSWGLQVEAQRTITLLFRQTMEKSDWLGPIVAEWASKPFTPAADSGGPRSESLRSPRRTAS